MRAGIEEVAGDREMRGCRRHDADRVDLTEQLAVVRDQRTVPTSPATLSRACWPRVSDGYELAPGRLRVFLGMKSAEIADTDDCCSDFLHEDGYYARPRPGH